MLAGFAATALDLQLAVAANWALRDHWDGLPYAFHSAGRLIRICGTGSSRGAGTRFRQEQGGWWISIGPTSPGAAITRMPSLVGQAGRRRIAGVACTSREDTDHHDRSDCRSSTPDEGD